MARTILITGGARSGKSRFAEERTLGMSGHAIYVAPAQALDAAMAGRIAEHRSRRGVEWTTHEAPLALVDALGDTDGEHPRLVDCLTLWLSNLMLAGRDWALETDRLVDTLPALISPVVFVTNEVGAGIVPDNKLARDFRDAAGVLNQAVAAACDEAYLMASGYPIQIKPNAHRP